uniref:nucleolar protein 16 isoform X1 n=1 Tax=Agelaius phoeniceus TaxID=39638 RepID=UPI0023EC1DB5|nr:nucleolar protein 16 isoform X1 [Agelaius phoeniceus]
MAKVTARPFPAAVAPPPEQCMPGVAVRRAHLPCGAAVSELHFPWCPGPAWQPRGQPARVRHAEGQGEEPAAQILLQPQPQAALPQRPPPRRAPHRLGMEVESDGQQPGKKIVRKPYVVNEMELEASLPEKKSNTLSRDLIDYVRYMIQNHGENYKEMARDEKNYYQDTPKQIKRKINVYKNFYPEEYKNFIASLKPEKMEVQ